MPASSTVPRVPSLRHHKATNQGYVVIDGRYLDLGRFREPKKTREYHRTISEWIGNGYQLQRDPNELTVTELVAAFWKHAESYYVKLDGTPTGETEAIKVALRPLKQMYGTTRATDFGPRALKAVRQHLIELGRSRTGINHQVGRIKRCFRWGVEHEMVSPSVYHALLSVPGLRRGRTEARETKPVTPVLEAHVTAVLPHVSRQVGAMIGLQLLTAARPGEIVMLRPIDFDTSGAVWLAKLDEHKTAYRGRERVLYFGPKAQKIVREFLADTPLDEYLIRPLDAARERLATRSASLLALLAAPSPAPAKMKPAKPVKVKPV